MRRGRLRPILLGAGAALLLSACGLSLMLGAPEGVSVDGGLDGTSPTRDAYVASDAHHLDAAGDSAVDAARDAASDAPPSSDGGRDASADADADAGPLPRRAFVSSGTFTGLQIGGLSGGDKICATEATAAALGGTWHAILGQNETYAAIIARIGNRKGAIVLVDGTPVVEDISKLVTAAPSLAAAITLDADLGSHPGAVSWTGIAAGAGSTGASTNHCVKWASDAAAQKGVVGKGAQLDSEFLMQKAPQDLDTCDKKHRIYCIEE